MAYIDSSFVQWDHGLGLDAIRSAGTSFGNLETYEVMIVCQGILYLFYGERERERERCVNCKLQSVLKIKKKTCVKHKMRKKKNLTKFSFIDLFTISKVIYHRQQHLCH